MSATIRKVFAVDIHAEGIEAYKAWHRVGGPPQAVTDSIRADDIRDLEIWLVGDRMMLLMEQGPNFDPAAKAKRDTNNPDVLAWDALMRTFQKPLPFGPEGSTWLEMARIYSLSEQP
ncbi:L-rhamnose mutarotase [Asticcacaulis taihuensis]|jgi:L-rhamnose mutarotase|uniref:L-rhamnose mutarotase n=1 Tax=Asticcacaulis taihuensis TaxID=260084 RepID=UPI003F7BE9E3